MGNDPRILVHCRMGISRSVTFVLAYLLHAKRIPLRYSFPYLRQLRPIVMPNGGFWLQLKEYEYLQLGKNSIKLVPMPSNLAEEFSHLSFCQFPFAANSKLPDVVIEELAKELQADFFDHEHHMDLTESGSARNLRKLNSSK